METVRHKISTILKKLTNYLRQCLNQRKVRPKDMPKVECPARKDVPQRRNTRILCTLLNQCFDTRQFLWEIGICQHGQLCYVNKLNTTQKKHYQLFTHKIFISTYVHKRLSEKLKQSKTDFHFVFFLLFLLPNLVVFLYNNKHRVQAATKRKNYITNNDVSVVIFRETSPRFNQFYTFGRKNRPF